MYPLVLNPEIIKALKNCRILVRMPWRIFYGPGAEGQLALESDSGFTAKFI